jgi:hypothetical protein
MLKIILTLASMTLASAGLILGEQWTGWVTDEACAKAGQYTGESHQKHVDQGQAIVFVEESTKKTRQIQNTDMVNKLVGQKVTLTGTAKPDGSIEVESVANVR